MSVEHLDTLYTELPEIFQARDLAPEWDEGLIMVSIDDPEWGGDEGSDDKDRSPLNPKEPEQRLPFEELESSAATLDPSEIGIPTWSPEVLDAVGGAHAGAPMPRPDPNRSVPPECLAFYLPFHYYHPTWWGVYLLYEGVLWLAADIVRRTNGRVPMGKALRAARLFLYYHEAFHHKTECFATRLELSHRRPFFKTGFERLYQQTFGTTACVEEGLANASALNGVSAMVKDLDVQSALVKYVEDSPPGYDQGQIIRPDLIGVRCRFAEANQNLCLPHVPQKDPNVWRATPNMFNGFANIKARVNYVIPRNSPFLARTRFRPLLPPRQLVAKLKAVAGLQFVRHGAGHDIYRSSSGASIAIPRHPRDLGEGLVRKILKRAGLDMSLREFLQV